MIFLALPGLDPFGRRMKKGVALMIIGIESVYADKLLSGKTLTFSIIQSATSEILKTHDEKSFAAAFCARFGYKELPYSEGYAAYIIDLDTHKVFVTSYTLPKELNGAKVLYYTDRGVFEPVYYPGGEIAHNVSYLAVCKYENESAFYLFHCDESLDVVADDYFQSLEECQKHTESYDLVWHKQKK